MILNISVPVDAGCIVLIDYGEISSYLGDDDTRLPLEDVEDTTSVQMGPAVVKLDPGFYSVGYEVRSWNGNSSETARMSIPTGKLAVADLCHVVDSRKWQDFLGDTDCLKKFPNPSRSHVIDTGGDGRFHVHLKIKPLGLKELK